MNEVQSWRCTLHSSQSASLLVSLSLGKFSCRMAIDVGTYRDLIAVQTHYHQSRLESHLRSSRCHCRIRPVGGLFRLPRNCIHTRRALHFTRSNAKGAQREIRRCRVGHRTSKHAYPSEEDIPPNPKSLQREVNKRELPQDGCSTPGPYLPAAGALGSSRPVRHNWLPGGRDIQRGHCVRGYIQLRALAGRPLLHLCRHRFHSRHSRRWSYGRYRS